MKETDRLRIEQSLLQIEQWHGLCQGDGLCAQALAGTGAVLR